VWRLLCCEDHSNKHYGRGDDYHQTRARQPGSWRALAISSAVIAADAPDPVIGTWKLNTVKSTGVPLAKSDTRTYAASAGGIVLTWKRVGADGKKSSVETVRRQGLSHDGVARFRRN
jgi:hypothetical protein